VGRYGGEEFMAILVEATLDEAEHVAERVRTAISEFNWEQLAAGLQITVSVGVAALGEASDANGLVNLADSRLYLAKSGGKNRVCAA
jgi:diguanylate cyclase (GGDEF)-like protein